MPLIDGVLNPNSTGAQVVELHKQLAELGAVIKSDEQTAKRFGDSTAAAVRTFQTQHGLPVNGVLDKSTAQILHLASTFAGPGGRAALQVAVKEVVPAAQNSEPAALVQFTRMALLAGEYAVAGDFASHATDQQQVREVLQPIMALPVRAVEVAPTQAPAAILAKQQESIHPENFYVYRRDLYPIEVLNTVQNLVKQVGEPPRDPSQASGPDLGPDFGRGAALIAAAASWFEAIRQWQQGNLALEHREFGLAQAAYDACQSAACDYFSQYHEFDLGSGPVNDRLSTLIRTLERDKDKFSFLWSVITERRNVLTLEELRALDFPDFPGHEANLLHPRFNADPLVGAPPAAEDFGLGFIQFYLQREESSDPTLAERQSILETPLITIAFVLAPLARAEANRARRQYDAAVQDLRWVLDSVLLRRIFGTPQDPHPAIPVLARLASEFIELPFARLLLAETLLDKADAEYKARVAADPPPAPDVSAFQGLKAAQSYLALKNEFARSEPQYVERVEIGRNRLLEQIQDRLAKKDTTSQAFQVIGKEILVPTIDAFSPALPGLDRRMKAHEPLLKFIPPKGQPLRETNPRVYAVLLMATARLEQLRAGFNYLGYLDSYVPPFRFQFLLERARYFAEHAKNAQRDFLNFLSNAEREDLQESSAAQNVEMEKSNLRVETARVDQTNAEVTVAQKSNEMAGLTAADAQTRFDHYTDFDAKADDLTDRAEKGLVVSGLASTGSSILSGAATGASIGAAGGPIGALGGAIIGGLFGLFSAGGQFTAEQAQLATANEQREFEKQNLNLAVGEANKAAEVADAQLAAAQSGLIVAGLQRQAALLRHEFALQNLQFLRGRTLNTEQWYRLADAIRSISETYLRYAIELSFLAEQAYEFEADKRINVIRFDYDLSEVGNFLAADFLLGDLDTLENDLIVTQRQREQHVRYVLSMAREFPEALQEIRDNGKATFSLRLEQLEQRFPGLYNLRIGAVDVLPVALLDSTRFSLELTHLGTSQVRLKAQPDTPPGIPSTSPLNTNDLPIAAGGWLAELQETYPIKLRVTGPETAVFSGLTRQDASAVFAFTTSGQRQAFEALGAAAAWQVDFTARENQVVPGTLADLLITFTLSGYHDSELRSAIDHAPRLTTATTSFISGQTTFPDALYEFNRSGRMVWNVTRERLTLTDTLGAVRNVAVLLLPANNGTNYYGRLLSRCDVPIRISKAGDLEVLSVIPQVTFTPADPKNPLSLTATVDVPASADISWDFGDGSARQVGKQQQHSYAKPGRYTVTLRVVRQGRLVEFRAVIVVSRTATVPLSLPVTAFPTLKRQTGRGVPKEQTRVVGTANATDSDPVAVTWRVDGQESQKGATATFDLLPGDYTVSFTAVRPLQASVYASQRHLVEPKFAFTGLGLATNRRFNLNGDETTGSDQNPPATLLTKHLFADGAMSPVDAWTLELSLADNPFLRSVSASDVEQVDLAEIQDALLVIEYETTAV